MKMIYALAAAVAVGAVIGGVRSGSEPPPVAAAEPVPVPAAAAPIEDTGEEPSAGVIEGAVLEVTQVPNYSYYRLQTGGEGTWVAVPTGSLKVGDRARVVGAMKMTGFKSTALGRTFPVIWFGTLEGGAAPHGHASSADAPHDPHAQAAQAAHAADAKPVERAKGGKTVAEIIGERAALSGKKVRLHATVVKSTPGVLGRTWLHLRDGSGAEGSNDLVATTQSTPRVGETITVECSVALDRDVGSGYRFATILEDCAVQ